MEQNLQAVIDSINQNAHLSDEEKDAFLSGLKAVDKKITITELELEHTEKVKRTTATLLEETMQELERTRKEVEAQNRELEIEAALERVRTVAMGMNKAEDMLDVCKIISQQLELLNVKEIRNVQTAIFYKEKGTYMNYEYYAKHNNTFITETTYSNNERHAEFAENMQKGNGQSFELNITDVKEWIAYQKTTNVFIDDFLYSAPSLNYYWYSLGPVALGNSTYQPLKEAEKALFRRFVKVFELAYRRYLDIEQAEAQAREAQIELSLERVRAKTMSMHNSNDVADTVATMFDEVVKLGIETIRCGIGIMHDGGEMEVWAAKPDDKGNVDLIIGRLDMMMHPLLKGAYESWLNKIDFYTYQLVDDDLVTYFTAINNHPAYPIKYDIASLPKKIIHTEFQFAEGTLFVFSLDVLPADAKKIFKRFAAVFGQTYRRFLDLQKAEAQALEAVKRASVDRVRAEIASMRTTGDLERITPLIWNELTTLGVPFIRCGVFIMDEEAQQTHTFLSTPGGMAIATLHVPFNFNLALTRNGVAHWREKKVYQEHWDKPAFIQSWAALATLNETAISSTKDEHLPENLYLHLLPFLQGMLYVGSEVPLGDEAMQLCQNLADAFATAYARYEDFSKLEAAKQQVDSALNKLQATQKQLIQSEKMASLGELTAGIAHEIQNPLNFVNNFSEVSNELIDEMNEELSKGDIDEARNIAADIKQNLEKINHHGKRADAIVKGMLQHSRRSASQKESTGINALADEYLRLSYHGLRAKDKSFNATLNTDYDTAIGNINIIPQDIGRVLINLFNNAFYAVTEKKKAADLEGFSSNFQGLEAYQPTITLTTKRLNPL